MREHLVRLPRPARGGWLLMLVVGGALAAIGVAALERDRRAGLLALGGGLVLASAASLVLAGRETSATLHWKRDALELAGDDGLSVPLALEPPVRSVRIDGPRGAIVALADRRGLVELGALEESDADKLASLSPLAQPPLQDDPKLPHRVHLEGRDPLAVRWSAHSFARGAACCALGCGLTCVAGSAAASHLLLWIGFGGALVLGIAGGLGAVHRLRIDAGAVELTRGRNKRDRVPLADIVGVDAVKEIGTSGPGILLRTAPLGERPSIAHPGLHAPTGGLSCAGRVALARLVAARVFDAPPHKV